MEHAIRTTTLTVLNHPRSLSRSEQCGRTDSERASDPVDNQIARVRRAAFDSPDVILVDVREFGQLLLRETALVP